MFKKIFAAIKNLFSSLFGGGKKKTPTPTTDLTDAQDGSEITADTIVVVADEMDHIVIRPGDPDNRF